MPRQKPDILMPAGAPGSWDHLIRQSGMFGFLGLSPEIVLKLKGQSLMFLSKLSCLLLGIKFKSSCTDDYHIYMAGNSRISIAGLNPGNVEYVARSITQCLQNS